MLHVHLRFLDNFEIQQDSEGPDCVDYVENPTNSRNYSSKESKIFFNNFLQEIRIDTRYIELINGDENSTMDELAGRYADFVSFVSLYNAELSDLYVESQKSPRMNDLLNEPKWNVYF